MAWKLQQGRSATLRHCLDRAGGAPPTFVANQMGHADLSVTMPVYAHPWEKQESIEQAVAGSRRRSEDGLMMHTVLRSAFDASLIFLVGVWWGGIPSASGVHGMPIPWVGVLSLAWFVYAVIARWGHDA